VRCAATALFQLLIELLDLVLCFFTLSNVSRDSGDAIYLAAVISYRIGAVPDPAYGTVWPGDPILLVVCPLNLLRHERLENMT